MDDSNTFHQNTQRRDQAPPTAPLWEARLDDSYTFHQNTQRRDQAPPTAPLWEARLDDSYTWSSELRALVGKAAGNFLP